MDKILILEDEIGIRSFVSINLKREGYEVIEAGTGSEAIEKLNSEPNIAVALLDIMLPDMSGVDICRYIRDKYENMGIIMLTAKAQEDDKIEGFVAGADDYMIKPFSIKELLFRVSALIRRVNKDNDTRKSSVLDLPPFSLDINKRKLYKNGNVVDLTPTEFSIVKFLMINASDSLKIVDVNIRRIRNKIEEDPTKPKSILTAWGYGYTFRRAD